MARSTRSTSRSRSKALGELAKRLGDKSLVAEVALAVDDPETYYARFTARMNDIGIDEPRADLGWLALVEGLGARDKQAEVDWKQECSDVVQWVIRLSPAAGKKVLKPIAKQTDLDERPTHEGLQMFGRALGEVKLALVHFDKNSDSYALAVVAAKDVKALQKLARDAGGEIVHHDGSELAALEKERAKVEQKDAKRRASTKLWDQQLARVHDETTDGVLWQLRHHPFPVEEIRAAASTAPKAARPLIAMVLALHDGDAAAVARTAKDAKLCLKALRYLGGEKEPSRLAAAAVLAERLKIVAGKKGALQAAICDACNLFCDGDHAFVKLPAKQRALLARIVDGQLGRSSENYVAMYALKNVGDAASLERLREIRQKLQSEWPDQKRFEIDESIERIEKRITAGR